MHGDGHISGNGVAGSDGIPAGDRLDCTGQRLKRAVQCHLSGLPHVEGSSVLSGEGDGQCHGAVVADGGDGLPLTDLVPSLTSNVYNVPEEFALTVWFSAVLS